MRKSFLIAALALLLLQISSFAQEREYLWGKKDAYIEWLQCPAKTMEIGSCALFFCDKDAKIWSPVLARYGVQSIYVQVRGKYAFKDAQRAVRLVRSRALERGLNPARTGVVAMSDPSIALQLASKSQSAAYTAKDKIDSQPCNLTWAIINIPEEFASKIDIAGFDSSTCPMCLHGKGSTRVYRQLRRMQIPADLHIYPYGTDGEYSLYRSLEFLKQMSFLSPLGSEQDVDIRFASNDARASYSVEPVWPEGKTPDFQEHQHAPYIEWHIPKVLKTSAIQIMYSGGSYEGNSPEWFEVAPVRRFLNEQGMTVVTLSYRYPRPKGLAKHITAWQDLQRTIRIVRSQAAERGLDPNRIGIYGCSAGGHLTLMGVTSASERSYQPIDELDSIPCNVQWGIGIYPAYALTDGAEEPNSTGGNDDSAVLVPEFAFDSYTAPMLFLHGDADAWAAMNSVKALEKLDTMGIEAELHSFALRSHCFMRYSSAGTGSFNYMGRIRDFLQYHKLLPAK